MYENHELPADRFLANLGAAIQIRTVSHESPQDNDRDQLIAFHRFLRSAYPLIHERCSVETVNELSLLITWSGSESGLDPLLLMAHQDVVPVEPGTEGDWESDPFGGEIKDGYLWGRGAFDDKGSLIAMLESIEHLLRSGFEPTRTILVALGHDEEIHGLGGAKEIAGTLGERGHTPWFVVDEGGGVADELPRLSAQPVALVRTAEKGLLNLKLTARGEGGHSSAPRRPTTIGKLATALQTLESSPMRARVGIVEPTFEALKPRLGRGVRLLFGNLEVTGVLVKRILSRDPATEAWIRTTAAITIISGGVKANVIPQEAWAVVNFRIIPGDTVESVIAHVRRVVGPDIEIELEGDTQIEASPVSSTESPAWNVMAASVEEIFPEAVAAPWTLVAATDGRYFADISGDVYGFSPFTLAMSDFERIHGTGERIRVADAERAVGFFVTLIQNASEYPT